MLQLLAISLTFPQFSIRTGMNRRGYYGVVSGQIHVQGGFLNSDTSNTPTIPTAFKFEPRQTTRKRLKKSIELSYYHTSLKVGCDLSFCGIDFLVGIFSLGANGPGKILGLLTFVCIPG
jgi:hypothetical protein